MKLAAIVLVLAVAGWAAWWRLYSRAHTMRPLDWMEGDDGIDPLDPYIGRWLQ